MKRVVSMTLALIMIIAALFAVSCTDNEGNERNDGEQTASQITIAENGVCDYKIICPVSSTNRERYSAMEMQKFINDTAGTSLEVFTDDVEIGEKEILFGNTNREESAKAKELVGENDYIVKVIGRKLVVYATEEKYYDYAMAFIKYNLADGDKIVAFDDLEHISGGVATFVADETIEGKMDVNISVTPFDASCRVGLFVGKEADNTQFGYKGYAVLLEKDTITLYEMGKKLTEMGSKKIDKIKAGKKYDLRLVVNQTSIAAYILDDAEGYEPWPEIEMKTSRTSGSYAGFVELSGYGALYEDFSVSEHEGSYSGSKYTNAIYANYADPDVLAYDGMYYLYGTGGQGYRVHTSKDLVNWKDEGICAENNLWGVKNNYWAPDIEYINGKFYMVVSCNESIGIAVSDSPKGPFKEHSKNILYRNSIDGHLFVDDDGTVYLYYVSWISTYGIYGVQLDSDLKPIAKTQKLLISPGLTWEMKMGNVTEGPYMLKHNGMYYLTYSGSHYESPDYAVGYATSGSPLGTFKKYSLNPIMIGNTQIHGTGHHCIVTTLDSTEMFIVYHCHNSVTEVQQRKICIDRIRFSPVEGKDDRLEVYGPTVIAQPYPGK